MAYFRPVDRKPKLFEFICDHIIPGCTHVDRDEDRDKLLERAGEHLKDHHDLDYTREPIAETLRTTALRTMPPL